MSLTDAFKTDIAHVGDFIRTSGADIGTITGLANYKRALFHRLITVPGALVHRPNYGVGVSLFQNGLSSFGKQQQLASKIEEQFMRDPRTEKVTSISISSDENPQRTQIKISVKPVGYSEQEILFTPFSGAIG